MKAIVIGGGAAGMGAAWQLRKKGIEVTLIEREEDLGGRCRTFFWEGAWQIRGAFAFVSSEENLISQAKELGIYSRETVDDLTESHSQYVLHPEKGLVKQDSLSPTDILKSPLLGWKEKASLALMLPTIAKQLPRNDLRDLTSAAALDTETAYDYVKAISPNFADWILEPTMQMFCGYGKEDYSKAWLVWLMAGLSWGETWWSFKERGVGGLSHAFEENFKKDPGVNLHLGSTVTNVDYNDDGVSVKFSSEAGEQVVNADVLVMAIPAPLVPAVMPGLDSTRAEFLSTTGYVGHHIAYYVIETEEKDLPYSLMLPSIEGYERVSNLHFFPHGENKYLVTGELKGAFCQETLGMSEEVILEKAWEDFVKAEPRVANVKFLNQYLQRNDLAICRRETGYVTRLKAFRELPPIKRVAFAGDYLINSTVGQAHWSGLQAADELIARL